MATRSINPNKKVNDMIIGIGLLVLGIVIGLFLHNKKKIIKIFTKLTDVSIFLLLFFLGVSVGMNDRIISNFQDIGLQSVSITIAATAGSVLITYIVYRLFFKKKAE